MSHPTGDGPTQAEQDEYDERFLWEPGDATVIPAGEPLPQPDPDPASE
jgi:hypothetical protein